MFLGNTKGVHRFLFFLFERVGFFFLIAKKNPLGEFNVRSGSNEI